MESEPSMFSEENPPTFGDLLALVASGESSGFTVFSADGAIGYAIFEPGEVNEGPEDGETWVPMTPEDAQGMIDELTLDAAEELLEIGRQDAHPPSSQN